MKHYGLKNNQYLIDVQYSFSFYSKNCPNKKIVQTLASNILLFQKESNMPKKFNLSIWIDHFSALEH